jgi:flagellar biogenesis protein FliO
MLCVYYFYLLQVCFLDWPVPKQLQMQIVFFSQSIILYFVWTVRRFMIISMNAIKKKTDGIPNLAKL